MERSEPTLAAGFRNVAVITFALHAKGPQFETGAETEGGFCSPCAEMAVWQAGGPRCKGLNFVVGEGKFLRDSAQTVTPNELCPVCVGFTQIVYLLAVQSTYQFSQKEHKTKFVEFL